MTFTRTRARVSTYIEIKNQHFTVQYSILFNWAGRLKKKKLAGKGEESYQSEFSPFSMKFSSL